MPLICIIVWRDVRHHILHAVVLESIRCGLRIWCSFSAIGAEFCTGRKVFSAAAASDDRRQLCAAARAEKSARVTAENTTGWTLADFKRPLWRTTSAVFFPTSFVVALTAELMLRSFWSMETNTESGTLLHVRIPIMPRIKTTIGALSTKMMLSIQPSVSDLTAALVNHTMTRTMADRITGPIKPVASTGLLFVKAL